MAKPTYQNRYSGQSLSNRRHEGQEAKVDSVTTPPTIPLVPPEVEEFLDILARIVIRATSDSLASGVEFERENQTQGGAACELLPILE